MIKYNIQEYQDSSSDLFFFFYTGWCGNGFTQTHHELTLIYAESPPIDLERKHVVCHTVCVCIYSHSISEKTSNQSQIFFLSDFIIFSSSDTLILEWHSRVWFPPLLNPSDPKQHHHPPINCVSPWYNAPCALTVFHWEQAYKILPTATSTVGCLGNYTWSLPHSPSFFYNWVSSKLTHKELNFHTDAVFSKTSLKFVKTCSGPMLLQLSESRHHFNHY